MAKHLIPCANCGSKENKLLTRIKVRKKADFIDQYCKVVICANCGLVFLNPQYSEEDYFKFYESIYFKPTSDDILFKNIKADNEKNKERNEIVNFLLKNINFKNKTMLDIGSGTGELLYFLKEKGVIGEGLEISDNAVNFSRNLGLLIHKGSIEKNNINKKYDIAIAIALIEHVLDPIYSLKKMRELLKDNGYLYINTPDYMGMNLRRKGIKTFFKFVHTYYYTEITLSSLMQKAGFKIIKIDRIKKTKNRRGVLQILAQKSDYKDEYLKDDVKKLIWKFKKSKIKYGIIRFIKKVYKKINKYE